MVRDGWIAVGNLSCARISEEAHASQVKMAVPNKFQEEITQITGKATGLKLIGTLKTCDDCTLRKSNMAGVRKSAVER